MELRTGTVVTDVKTGYVRVWDERIDAVVTLWAAGGSFCCWENCWE